MRAAFRDRSHVEFTNSRERDRDGPIGFTSTELMLITLGNCSLGWLLDHEPLLGAQVLRAEAWLEPEIARDPRRITRISSRYEVDVVDAGLLGLQKVMVELLRTCPMGNTLSSVEIDVELGLKVRSAG